LRCEGLDNGVPTLLERLYALLELFIFAIAGGLFRRLWWWCRCLSEAVTRTQLSVLFLELLYPPFKLGELGFAAVSRILCGDAVAVSPGFLALLRRNVRARAFSGWARLGDG
jgi:hypothetical protein